MTTSQIAEVTDAKQLSVNLAVAKLTGSVEATQLIALAKPFLALLFAVSSSALSAQTKAQFLATVAETGYFLTLREFIEWVETQDAADFSVEKVLQEASDGVDAHQVYLTKQLTEGSKALDGIWVALEKAFQEQAQASEDLAADFGKVLHSFSGLSDAALWGVLKGLADTPKVDETAVVGFFKSRLDAAKANDFSQVSSQKALHDASIVSSSTSAVFEKARQDVLGAADEILVRMLFYREFSDSGHVQDSPTAHIHKFLSESLLVQDLLYFGKARAQGSTDSVGFSEKESFSVSKELQDSASTLSFNTVDVWKAVQESFACTMLTAAVLNKARAEYAIVGTIKNIVFNKAAKEEESLAQDTGYMFLQSYVASNYFSDDYTGSKYIFGE